MFFKAIGKRKYVCKKTTVFEDAEGKLKSYSVHFHQHYTKKEAAAQSEFDEIFVKKDGDTNNIHRINDLTFEYDDFDNDHHAQHIRIEYVVSK